MKRTSDIGLAVGSKVLFDPASVMVGIECFWLPRCVEGTVVYIDQANQWFLVEWGPGLRAGFKMDDLGGEVLM